MHVNPHIAALLTALNNPALPGIDLSLTRMKRLLAALGNPEQRVPPAIHVAGTNGKGSTIAFLRALLEAQGKRVHVYSSPHLVRFNERIVLSGREIDDARLLPLLQRVQAAAQSLPVTFFEATTAAAFLAFAETEADYLLLEVGLGGRLDATNVLTPCLSIITPVGLDHQEYLGEGLAEIAGEKAGIIKPGIPCIAGRQAPLVRDVLRARAEAAGASCAIADEEWIFSADHARLTVTLHGEEHRLALPALPGAHQQHNAALAVAALMQLGLPVVPNGLPHARWPGRLQAIARGPVARAWDGGFYLDGAHNAHAATALAAWAVAQSGPVVMVAGMMARKDAEAFFHALHGAMAAVVTVPIPGHGDAQTAEILCAQARAAGLISCAAPDIVTAVCQLQRYKPATLLVAGSLYLVGELLKNHE